jgi:hypothetical protein
MSGPIYFCVTLRTHHDRAYRRLARTLKTALRRDQLRAIKVREVQQQPPRTHANESPPASRDTLGGTPKERKS